MSVTKDMQVFKKSVKIEFERQAFPSIHCVRGLFEIILILKCILSPKLSMLFSLVKVFRTVTLNYRNEHLQ